MKTFATRIALLFPLAAITLSAAAQTTATTSAGTLSGIDPNAFDVPGTVISLNLSDKGVPEGIIMQSAGGVGQVNFPHEMADALARAVHVNDKVEVLVYPDNGPAGPGRGGPQGAEGGPAGRGGPEAGRGGPNQMRPDHEVFKLVAFRDAKGKIYDASAAKPEHKSVHVSGTIKAVNFNNRGIPNGVQLSTGDFVRLNERLLQQVDLTPDTPFDADGNAETMPNGHYVVQPHAINGTVVEGGRGGPGGPGGPDGPPPPPDQGPPPPPDNGPAQPEGNVP